MENISKQNVRHSFFCGGEEELFSFSVVKRQHILLDFKHSLFLHKEVIEKSKKACAFLRAFSTLHNKMEGNQGGNMRTQQLHYALTIYQEGSITKAATKLSMAQPNLSNAVKKLEQEIGFAIFKRSVKGVTPTRKGLLFLEKAQQVMSDLHELEHMFELETAN